MCSLLEWDSVEARRTAGYLFSLEHGAQRLLDLDARWEPTVRQSHVLFWPV